MMVRRPGIWLGLAALLGAIASLSLLSDARAADPGRIKSSDEFVSRSGPAIDPETHPGRQIYEQNCAACHEGGVAKAPARVWLEMLAPDAILHALTDGVMSQQAAHLSSDQKEQVAEYLTRTRLADYHPPAPPAQCTGPAAAFDGAPPAQASWGHDTRRYFNQADGGLVSADLPKLKLKWAFAFPNAVRARSQASIGWNTIFVGSQDGTVYALDLASGCSKWTFRAPAEVRTAIVADADAKRLYFGDALGRAYALDAFSGKQLWRIRLDDHPNATITGAPTLAGESLYVPISSLEVTSAANPAYACCTFRGAVVALNPQNGSVRWKYHVIPEPARVQKKTAAGTIVMGPSGAPVWTSPTYDAARGRIYVGTGENYSTPADGNSDALIALDASTGKRVWQAQLTSGDAWNVGCMLGNEACPDENGPDYDLSASPLLIPLGAGKDIIVAGQKSGMAYGIDPADGRIVWSQRLGHGGTQGGVHFGMAASGSRVFVPIVDMADTRDGREYDKAQNGAGIHAIDAATGKVLWRQHASGGCEGLDSCDPGISAAATAIPGAVLAGHLNGWFKAYDAENGQVLWEFDTKTPVAGITPTMAKGGSMSGPGPAVYSGHLVFSSGYGMYYHMPGNALYVFGK